MFDLKPIVTAVKEMTTALNNVALAIREAIEESKKARGAK